MPGDGTITGVAGRMRTEVGWPVLGSLIGRLSAFALLWLAWAFGSAPWEQLVRTLADPDASTVTAAGAVAKVTLASAVLLGLIGATLVTHVANVVFTLAELVFGLRVPPTARWVGTGDERNEAILDAAAAAVLIFACWMVAHHGESAASDVLRGLLAIFAAYFGGAAVVHLGLVVRGRVEPVTARGWEMHTLHRMALCVAFLAAGSVVGLSAAAGVHEALPEFRHSHDLRYLELGDSIDPCTLRRCEGRRAYVFEMPPSGVAYVAIHDFEGCDGGPWDVDGAPLKDEDGQPVIFELRRFGDSERAAWISGTPGDRHTFVIEACAFSLVIKEAL